MSPDLSDLAVFCALVVGLLAECIRLRRRVAPLRDEAEAWRTQAELARIGRDSERRWRERAERQAYELLAHRNELRRAALAYLAAHAAADAADEAIDDAADRVAATTAAGHAACAEADALEALRRATQGDRP